MSSASAVLAAERPASASKEIKILAPGGMLGYGIIAEDFWRGIEEKPDAIIMDSGSTDPGPYLLGLGATLCLRESYERDLKLVLAGRRRLGVPLLIGSAGGAGIANQVNLIIEIIRELNVGQEPLKVAAIYADIDPDLVRRGLIDGKISPCASAPPLTNADIDLSENIVAQMGAEPFLEVLQNHPDVDVIIAGRAYDPAPFAAFCMHHGIDPGVFWHMGKIIECGAMCAEPKSGVILATLRKDSFDLRPMNLASRCTITSVAAHTLYEKSRPDLLPGPGGVLDLSNSQYQQLDPHTVRISGSNFVPSEKYQVKLEGAGIVGFRTIFIGGIRDPILIPQIDDVIESIRQRLGRMYPEFASSKATIKFHIYGKDGVMENWEPLSNTVSHEIGILCEVTAPEQDLASAICAKARVAMLHATYPGQLATAGSLALPINPPETPTGPVCRFTLYHLLDVESPTQVFTTKLMDLT